MSAQWRALLDRISRAVAAEDWVAIYDAFQEMQHMACITVGEGRPSEAPIRLFFQGMSDARSKPRELNS